MDCYFQLRSHASSTIQVDQDNMQDRVSRDRTFGLKQPDVDAIKLLYNSKTYSAKELSLLYQVSLNTIYYTLNNRK